MFEDVYKLHGLPKHIISDRDVLFTSIFWGHLHKLMGTKLKMSSAYHPETDGSTERANRTVTQMLCQCISEKQSDWVAKLPAIEFAINSARSESTSYTPFFLNTGRMPKSMIWDSARSDEYPSVRTFALERKLALISAHDSILAARVKQMRNTNRKRQLAPFKENDLVYLSTKNITFPKGLARKLVPKFIGPYKILKDFKNQSFLIDLPSHLKQRGVHNVFHAALLRIHVPNDDQLFPGRMDTQLSPVAGQSEGEWAIEKILAHSGSAENALFQVQWKAGDITWLPYYQIAHLNALPVYLDLLGVEDISKLPKGQGTPPADDPQIFVGFIALQETLKPHLENSSNPSPTRLNLPATPHTLQKPSVCHRQSSQPSQLAIMTDLPTPAPIVTDDVVPVIPATPIAATITPKNPKEPKYTTLAHRCLERPCLTIITVTDPVLKIITSYHVGQVALYCLTDTCLRNQKPPRYGLPAGYEHFTTNFNIWAEDSQKKWFASYDETLKTYNLTGEPIDFSDFNIAHEIVRWASRTASVKRKEAPAFESSKGTALTLKRMKIVNGLLWKVAESAAEEEEKAIRLKFKKYKKHTGASHPPSSASNSKKRDSDSSSGASAIVI